MKLNAPLTNPRLTALLSIADHSDAASNTTVCADVVNAVYSEMVNSDDFITEFTRRVGCEISRMLRERCEARAKHQLNAAYGKFPDDLTFEEATRP